MTVGHDPGRDLAHESYPWVVHDPVWDTWAIDFDVLMEAISGLAGEHHALNLTYSRLGVLRFAGSLAYTTPLHLRALLPALEYEHMELAMIAIAHSAGYTCFWTTDDAAARSAVSRLPVASWPTTPPHPALSPARS